MASASKKKIEDSQRLRYIRVLERFYKSIVSYLSKTDEISKEIYDKKIQSSSRYLERVTPVPLYKGEYNDLEKLVQKMCSLRESDTDIDEIKNRILKEANLLEKSINSRQYKRGKYRSKELDEW